MDQDGINRRRLVFGGLIGLTDVGIVPLRGVAGTHTTSTLSVRLSYGPVRA
jgi:hypothetical protein